MASDYSFTAKGTTTVARNLLGPMSATHDTTKDTAKKTAGKPAEMDLDTHELESTKAEHVHTPTKPRAVVGQPDTWYAALWYCEHRSAQVPGAHLSWPQRVCGCCRPAATTDHRHASQILR